MHRLPRNIAVIFLSTGSLYRKSEACEYRTHKVFDETLDSIRSQKYFNKLRSSSRKVCPLINFYCARLSLIAYTFFTASLSVNSLCHLLSYQFQSMYIKPTLLYRSPRKSRVVNLFGIGVRNQTSQDYLVPRDERQICDGQLVPDQVLLLRKDAI